MNESVIIQKMIAIGQSLEREEIFYSGAEADARALLEEIKQALTIPVVVGQSEQYYCEIHKEEMTYDTNVNEHFCWTCEHGQQ